jgi:N-acetylglucosaminyldiphosphoundecaprenol N-acetyl-beta-D-mannosaminyltransferase
MRTDRTDFLGIQFDRLSTGEVLEELARRSAACPFSYVVTPNVDHVVRLHEPNETDKALRAIYADADLCLCDSKVLKGLARLRHVRLPVTPGSDLTARIFEQVLRPGDRVAIVGGDAALVAELRARYPAIDFVQLIPPMGLRRDAAARRAAAEFIVRSRARFTFMAVGSPQQEMIAAEVKSLGHATGTALCIGAALEFLTGRKRRAPSAARKLGMEWAHRLLSDPARLWRRYLVEGPRIFLLAYRWSRPERSHGDGR